MTDKDCLNWMEKKGILNRWIRPVLGLNDEIIVTDANGKVKKVPDIRVGLLVIVLN